jgi:hypothetical protein
LRDLYDLRHTYATFGAPGQRPGVRPLAIHGNEHRDDRSPLRPSCSRQLSARSLAA